MCFTFDFPSYLRVYASRAFGRAGAEEGECMPSYAERKRSNGARMLLFSSVLCDFSFIMSADHGTRKLDDYFPR